MATSICGSRIELVTRSLYCIGWFHAAGNATQLDFVLVQFIQSVLGEEFDPSTHIIFLKNCCRHHCCTSTKAWQVISFDIVLPSIFFLKAKEEVASSSLFQNVEFAYSDESSMTLHIYNIQVYP
jgi:hypothetical protein